nr:cell envelope integrity EipB family protein [Pseudomonadota bacterium]
MRSLRIYLAVMALIGAMPLAPGWAASIAPSEHSGTPGDAPGALTPVPPPAAPAAPPAPAPASVAPAASESAKPRGAKIAIVPHRAIYDMTLSSVRNGSNITGVSGRMLFEWGDVCNGWAVQQHLRLHFTYSEGDESDVTSTELTWESKDGKRYNFNIRRVSDGKETERYVGKAVMKDDGGLVTYSVPAKKTVTLPAGTVFPSSHTKMILQNADAGERLFTRRVFDGSDEVGSDDISVFINPQPEEDT